MRLTRILISVTIAGCVAAAPATRMSYPRAKNGYPDTRPNTPEMKAAFEANEKMEAASREESDAAWQRIQPELAEWAKKGKPYFPMVEKPEDLPQASIPAFPGAEGAGAHAFGGRGGKVIVVTSLEDSGPGTLRDAVEQAGPRVVVFNVAGIIHLKTPLIIRAPYITIAGQSAPGDGVCIAGRTTEVNTHDAVIRYMRFRRGITDVYDRDDALGGEPIGNVIVDHCSCSWGLDETMSMYRHMYSPPGADHDHRIKQPVYNITLQWNFIEEGLDTYNHAFGATWGGKNTSFHHNLFACNTGRNASIGMGFDFNWINNVVFNWRHRTLDGGDGTSRVNCINNYYKPGPATNNNAVRYRIGLLQPTRSNRQYGKWYVAGNVVEGNEKVTADNWAGGVQFPAADNAKPEAEAVSGDSKLVAEARMDKPFEMAPVTIQSAKEAYQAILATGGAMLPKRDPVDLRIIDEVKSGKPDAGPEQNGIITDIEQVGGYPQYKGDPATDSDHDGIPDAWETAHGLNPNDASDAVKDSGDADGYTNIEKYLNSLTATQQGG